jgi:transcriptional regulator with AAA-type ATPase domain
MLGMGASRESTEDDRDVEVHRRPRARGESTALTLLFESGSPRAVAPFAIGDMTAITLGRSVESGAFESREIAGERRLVLALADKRMSQVHAQLRLTPAGWSLEDASSKNGTRVNGLPIKQTLLRPGDLIETGRSFLLFGLPSGPEAGPIAPDTPPGMVTFNRDLATQFERLAKIARSQIAVLVQGETGTGKELVAQAIHQVSGRGGPFQAVNCGGLPASLLESELFGYRRGAFSGATEDRPGIVRAADRGTLFLDEIGDLSPAGQAALLRVLQEGEVQPIGARSPVSVDVRVVAATHRDLPRMVAAGTFREDLFGRLNGFSLTLPPLRGRREDLGRLVHRLVERHAPHRAATITFSPDVVRTFHAHAWPRNIRELDKAIAAGLVLCEDLFGQDCLLPSTQLSDERLAAPSLARVTSPDAQKGALETSLEKNRGNVAAVAAEMRTSRMQVHRLCRRFGIDLRHYRPPAQ